MSKINKITLGSKITTYIIIVTSSFIFFTPFAGALTAEEQFNNSLDVTSKQIGYDKLPKFNQPLPQTIGEFIKIFLSFLGVIFLLLMIYGGYIWMIARGNEQEVEKAKKIIEHSIIGLVIIIGSYAFTYYIIDVILYPTV